MKIQLDYHRQGLWVEVPDRNLAGVIEKTAAEGEIPDAVAMLADAVRQPTGAPPLEDLARGHANACVVIPDITRPLPNRLALPPVLEAIERGGIPRASITILIATGLHRPNNDAEIEEMVGPEIARGWRIENHDARDGAAHMDLGETSNGVPILVDRRYIDADLKVIVGLVEPHFMAGYSGGRKMVCPGICGERTIQLFHHPERIEHPRSTNLVLEGNPTHLTSTEVARRVGVDFALNVVLDGRRNLIGAYGGDLEQSLLNAAEQAREEVQVPIDAPAEIVLTTGGGYPLDATWYQSIKGLVAPLPGVIKGGTIVRATGLREGIGSPAFQRVLKEAESDLDAFIDRIRQPGVYFEEQWQLEEFVLATRHARVQIYSDGLPKEVQQRFSVEPGDSVEAALNQALDRYGSDARILVMPHGPYLLPSVSKA